MMKLRHLSLVAQTVISALMMLSCMGDADPVRQSLDIETNDLSLVIGESSTRVASSKAAEAHFSYTSSKPSVALVDQNGKVTAMSEGEAIIRVHMDQDSKDWYAAADREYKVVVKNGTPGQIITADRQTPLTLVAQADGKIAVNFNGGITLSKDICYTVNGGKEQTISKGTVGAYDITVNKGDVVQLYSTNSALSSNVAGTRGATRGVADGAKFINIRPSMKTEIYGNVMSLLKGKDNFNKVFSIEGQYAFYGLFAGAENLVNNILRHVELPAIALSEGCYQAMFYGCKGLQRISELPATAVTKNCYQEMFADCSKLSYVKCLARDISVEGCTKNWLANAGSEATSEKKVASVIPFPTDSNDGVPTGWTNVTLIIDIPKLTMSDSPETMMVGGTYSREATAKSGAILVYTSSNEAVATVDGNGKVSALSEGTTTITALVIGGSDPKTGIIYIPEAISYELTTVVGLGTPLTMDALTAGTIVVSNPRSGMQYSKNGGAKTTMTSTTSIDVAIGDKVAFYGSGTNIKNYYDNVNNYTNIGGTADVKVYGNIMSLVNETNFATATELTADNTFRSLFEGNTKLKDASGLLLPATTLAENCYRCMFLDCTSLTTAPALPATNLTGAGYCYFGMFRECTSLTTAPALPATTLAECCYYGMFRDCTSLTTAPALPAEELESYCYQYMFSGCTSLTTAPKLPAESLVIDCYRSMFYDCTSLTKAYVKAAYNSSYCSYMFYGCTATGAVLHTTSANQAGWAACFTSPLTNWTIDAGWTD